MALATALLLTMILFSLAGVYLLFLREDTIGDYRKTMQAQAYYLALSGLHYDLIKHPGLVAGPFTRAVPIKDTMSFFELSTDPSGAIRSRGYVKNPSGRIIAQDTLILPPNSTGLVPMYDANQ